MTAPGSRLAGALLVAGAALCWSSGGVLLRLIEAGEWTVVFWRSLIMAVTVGLYLLLRHGPNAPAVVRGVGLAGLVSGCLLAITFACFVLAVARTEVANVVVLASASPLISALLAWLVLGERLLARTAITILVAFLGILLMFVGAIGEGSLVGNLLALGIALFFGVNIVVMRAARGVDMLPAMVLAGLISAASAWPLASPLAVSGQDFGLLMILGAGQLGLGLYLFVRGTRFLGAGEVGLLTLLETVLAPLWTWAVVGEVPPPLALAGGGIVFAALAAHSALGARRSKPPVGLQ